MKSDFAGSVHQSGSARQHDLLEEESSLITSSWGLGVSAEQSMLLQHRLDELNQLLQVLGSVKPVLVRFEQWETDGTLKHVDEVFKFMNAAFDSLTPEIVGSLVKSLAKWLETADVAMHSEITKLGPAVLTGLDEALREPIAQQKHELRHLLVLLKDKEVQDGLDIVFQLLRTLGDEHGKLVSHSSNQNHF